MNPRVPILKRPVCLLQAVLPALSEKDVSFFELPAGFRKNSFFIILLLTGVYRFIVDPSTNLNLLFRNFRLLPDYIIYPILSEDVFSLLFSPDRCEYFPQKLSNTVVCQSFIENPVCFCYYL